MKQLLIGTVMALSAAAPASAQEWAKARLTNSPRHGEWVHVKHGGRDVKCFIVYPEVKDKATAVLVIHEIFGLTDWVRSVADQLAEAGYIAIAPDLLSGMGSGGGGSETFSGDDVRRAIMDLPPQQITDDLNAVYDYVSKVPSCNGNVAVAGFCWGGRQTFRYATNNKDLKAAFVFYGDGPMDKAAIDRINCPVYGFYGEKDNRIDATIPKSEELMKGAGKTYDPVIYKGAGHGFMRAGEAPNAGEANKKARDEAWARWKELLKKI
jgi:carboxymethylenebutenolidase